MRFTQEQFEAARDIWEAQLEHPFVRGIADGSLDERRFRRWVRQDYVYLKDFARVFAWAAAKADGLRAMGWYARVLDLTLNTEMELHRDYAARFDVTPAELEATTPWPTTRAYTDFLVRTAADGDMARLLSALLPCAWGYAWVAERMAPDRTPDDERYADWIAQYTSEDFRDAAEWLRAETDRMAEGATDRERERLVETFVLSSRYEWRFWQMCWEGEGWSPRSGGA